MRTIHEKIKSISKDMSLRQKIMVMILSILVVMFALITYYKISSATKNITADFEMKVSSTGNLAGVALSDVMWNYDIKGTEVIGESLLIDREVAFVLISNENEIFKKILDGRMYSEKYIRTMQVPILKNDREIGLVTIGFTDYYRHKAIWQEVRATFFILVLAAVFIWGMIVLLIRTLVIPIKQLELGAKRLANGDLSERIEVESNDELGALAIEFNLMADSLQIMIAERDEALQELTVSKEEIRQSRDDLEIKVGERTMELSAMNQELIAINNELASTVDTLQETQSQLVQSEKMAALGSIVIGIAHEINTPVGVCLTAASYMDEISRNAKNKYELSTLTKSAIEEYFTQSVEASSLILVNAEKVAVLIDKFRRISTEQSIDFKRYFNVKENLLLIADTLRPMLVNSKLTLRVECDQNVMIESYPGTLSEILTDLVTNSITHAFGPDDVGEIIIDFERQESTCVLAFSDNGCGMESSVSDKIFEPFFTTRRGALGGLGLGLHIVYNLVTLRLNGTIECSSKVGEGTTFIIKFPMDEEEKVN
ncbi:MULTISPECIES: sensor histidine kinase [unclassified Fusibacter]|uniref:sensor histidine kinase n=1 Tax=unclassified Fusibacter TaxID=2624464 RepID=UPI00101274F4|nr:MULTISPECIES: ATP-binding protein [unclassified Fusibacter]MCK8060639.1 ATP-binding protein [Fusibacter sp. A2]NPE22907.1 HAMP domain-containing protein [Fusibacter sp. A1]RXV59975.1 HAMP domain-containing protein [Fusibacter sp. A1]